MPEQQAGLFTAERQVLPGAPQATEPQAEKPAPQCSLTSAAPKYWTNDHTTSSQCHIWENREPDYTISQTTL